MKRLIVASRLLWIALLPISSLLAEPVIVETQYGEVQGRGEEGYVEFLGIPYAQPPLEELRWEPSVEPSPWEGVLMAEEYAPACPQKKFEQGQPPDVYEIMGEEDCLYLNIWTPAVDGPARAVMVFIHGGGHQQGSASQMVGDAKIYDGKYLAEMNEVVVVTFDYRLGPLGYLAHEGLSSQSAQGVSGNYGLLDQILALDWVGANIASFGGDPNRVMVFGESAGAVSVANLIASPLAAGRFQSALMQSGAPVATSLEQREAEGAEFAEKLGFGGLDHEAQIAGLRTLDADSLISVLEHPNDGGIAQRAWGPAIDAWALLYDPLKTVELGLHNEVPVVIGSNTDETALMTPALVTPAMVLAFFERLLPPMFVEEALALYPPGDSNSSAKEAYIQATTDLQFSAMARRFARALADNQQSPVWRYLFSHRLSGPYATFGAYHGLELLFVFQTLASTEYGNQGYYNPMDSAVEAWLGAYWSRFADSGDPNAFSIPDWPLYESSHDPYLDIKPLPEAGEGLREAKCDFWDEVRSWIPTGIADDGIGTNEVLRTIHNHPNPFNPSTAIEFTLSEDCHLHVGIYDLQGRRLKELAEGEFQSGRHSLFWEGRDEMGQAQSSGVYLVRFHSEFEIRAHKLVLMK
jgi:para-nitrobenzyl esterase